MSHRTQITLTDEQYDRLRRVSRENGVALAELVRRALDRSYGPSRQADLEAALDATFGLWADQTEDGAAYVERLRRGMASRLERR